MKFFDKSLYSYGFPEEIVTIVKPIVDFIAQSDIKAAEHSIATLALNICDNIDKGIIAPAHGDKYFTLLDLFVGDNYKNTSFSIEVKDIIFEGMILHDLGKDYGTKLDKIRVLAIKILGG